MTGVSVPDRTPGPVARRGVGRRRSLATALLLLGLAVADGVARAQLPPDRDAALIDAAGRGDAPAVERLLAEGASVRARDGRGRTALMAATYGNHVPVARRLVAAGADVNAQDDMRNSPFLYAGAEGYLDILRLTLAAGADLESVNRYGGTALIPACHHGHVETVRELLKTSIDLNHVNRLGWTALLEAVILGDAGERHTDIVRLLVAAGADVNLPDRDGVSPLRHARQRGFGGIARILEGAGARP